MSQETSKKRNILSTTKVLQKFKEVDKLKDEVVELKRTIDLLKDKVEFLIEVSHGKTSTEAPPKSLDDDTYDPAIGPMPRAMRRGKSRITVKTCDQVITDDRTRPQ